jgi:uncharacterized protein with PQ loop repeat
MSELLGLSGASLAGYAYIPQISHLVRERCSAGISRGAFALWLLASTLMTIHAVLLPALVFVVLGVIQIGAISTILVYSARYRGQACPSHAVAPARDAFQVLPLRKKSPSPDAYSRPVIRTAPLSLHKRKK